MKRWIQHFYQLNRLNWLMVWLLLCCSIILLFPAGLMKGAVSQWATAHAAWLGVGMLIAISYFCSQGFLIAWEWACDEWQSRRQQDQLAQMIGFLDFNEKAVLREFVLQRKSVINLPITEPAVKNLMDAGVLTYAYGKPTREKEDENQIRALMIALPARPLLTYKVLGLSRAKMSDEQVEQIMNARPKFAQKSLQR
ncbi:superinfection exclusion B family protein [Aeromonas caviae]|uniref:superinfection exclusion B family protein n=1 Tax=Aeromonas caviae TaxID=648 RepID=UPI0023DC88B4|nr:superinfection exclusion B family protein [Aeromonas caviae]MDF2274847.1 superinfection exclusion B family protein [Aeromonas caviae]